MCFDDYDEVNEKFNDTVFFVQSIINELFTRKQDLKMVTKYAMKYSAALITDTLRITLLFLDDGEVMISIDLIKNFDKISKSPIHFLASIKKRPLERLKRAIKHLVESKDTIDIPDEFSWSSVWQTRKK